MEPSPRRALVRSGKDTEGLGSKGRVQGTQLPRAPYLLHVWTPPLLWKLRLGLQSLVTLPPQDLGGSVPIRVLLGSEGLRTGHGAV